jgi:hypothetical protein
MLKFFKTFLKIFTIIIIYIVSRFSLKVKRKLDYMKQNFE